MINLFCVYGNRLIRIITVLLAVLFLASCSKELDSVSDDVVFSMKVTELGENYVKIAITHNGTNRDRYCGFLVKGLVSDCSEEIKRYISEQNRVTMYDNSLSQRKKILQVDRLSPCVDYTYIVFGLSEDGCIYGKPASVCFKTEYSTIDFFENTDWNLQLLGEVFHNNAYWTGLSLIISGSCDERCLVWILSEDEYKGMDDICDIAYATVNSYKNTYQDMDEDDMWADNDWITNTSINIFYKRSPGFYRVTALGILPDGTLTGHYAITEPFKIEEYTPNTTYSQYYGDWVLSDACGESYNVSIKKKTVNSTLIMTGICGSSYPVVVGVDESTGLLRINYQTVKTGGSYTNSEGTTKLDAKLEGWYSNDGDKTFRTLSAKVALGIMMSDGTVHIEAASVLSESDVTYGMFFLLFDEEGEYTGKYLSGSKLTFPIKLVRR